MTRGDGLILLLLALLLGGVAALAKAVGLLIGKGDQVQGDQISEFELAIIQAASKGLKGQRIVVELRRYGILTNRETVRKTVKALQGKGYYV